MALPEKRGNPFAMKHSASCSNNGENASEFQYAATYLSILIHNLPFIVRKRTDICHVQK